MGKSKYQLKIKGRKKKHGKFSNGCSPKWLKTRHRVREKLLR